MRWLLLLLACGSPPQDDMISVVVAARQLNVGVPITDDDIVLVMMPPRYVPEGAFIAPVDVLGRVPAMSILADEPILSRRLADADLQRQLEALVPRGLEVTTILLSERADRPPVPKQDPVDLLDASGTVVVSAVPVLRVDGNRVAVMADPDQMEAILTATSALEARIHVPEADEAAHAP